MRRGAPFLAGLPDRIRELTGPNRIARAALNNLELQCFYSTPTAARPMA